MNEDKVKPVKDPDKKSPKKNCDYDAVKVRLKNIIKFKSMVPIIQKRVNITNEIWTEAYFLFNLLILDMLKSKKKIVINYNILERCILFVLNSENKVKKSKEDKEQHKTESDYIFKQLDEIYKKEYNNLTIDTNVAKYRDIKSIGRPFEYLSRQTIVNIKNHVQMNFIKFQKKYLMMLLLDFFNENKVRKNMRYSVVNFIQSNINNFSGKLVIKSERIKELLHKDIELYCKIINMAVDIIPQEMYKLPTSLRGKIRKGNLKANFTDGIQYYHLMIDYLEKNNMKRFPLLPQFTFKNKYIKFDSRLLSTIYNEWRFVVLRDVYKLNKRTIRYFLNICGKLSPTKYKEISNPDMYKGKCDFAKEKCLSDTEIKHILYLKKENLKHVKTKHDIPNDFQLTQIGIKDFERNFSDYRDRYFNFKQYNTSDKNPISFMTNGYGACILFESFERFKKPPTSLIKENDDQKINLDEYQKGKKFQKGLFDANDVYGSKNFLNSYHKIGIDPGNDVILYCQSESGKTIQIKKSYYNEISHITQNNKKIKKYIKESTIKDIYKKLTETNYKCTINLDMYKKYIEIYRSNRKDILDFYRQNKVMSLELDTFINKKKAIHTIVRKIVPKNNKVQSFRDNKNQYVDNELYDKVKCLPPLIAFGKGNGSITINNLKNNSPKGPVKTLAKELSRYCITIVTDEHNSSQCCNLCNEKLIHPTIKKKISRKVNDIILQKEVNHEVYRLCYCKNNIHPTTTSVDGVHKIWNRDYNASINILNIMTKKILGLPLGVFKKGSKSKKSSQAA